MGGVIWEEFNCFILYHSHSMMWNNYIQETIPFIPLSFLWSHLSLSLSLSTSTILSPFFLNTLVYKHDRHTVCVCERVREREREFATKKKNMMEHVFKKLQVLVCSCILHTRNGYTPMHVTKFQSAVEQYYLQV